MGLRLSRMDSPCQGSNLQSGKEATAERDRSQVIAQCGSACPPFKAKGSARDGTAQKAEPNRIAGLSEIRQLRLFCHHEAPYVIDNQKEEKKREEKGSGVFSAH
jgi:hypothetical protein